MIIIMNISKILENGSISLIRGGGGLQYFYAWRCERIQSKCGIDLQPNVVGSGIHIVHGKVVINAFSKIGCNCKILSDVTIGVSGRKVHQL